MVELDTANEAMKLHAFLKARTWEADKTLCLRTRSKWHPNADVPESGYRDVVCWLLIEADSMPMIVELHITDKMFHAFEGAVNLRDDCLSGLYDHPELAHLWQQEPEALWTERAKAWCRELQ